MPAAPVVLLATVPPLAALDTALDAARADGAVAVITAAPPARCTLAALCAERGVPCVVSVPFAMDPAGTTELRRRVRAAGVRVIPALDALVDPGVARVLDLAARGALGAVTAVTVTLGGAGDGLARCIEALALACATVPGHDAPRAAAAVTRTPEGALRVQLTAGAAALDVTVGGAPGVRLTVAGRELTATAERGADGAGRFTLARARTAETRTVPVPAGDARATLAAIALGGALPRWLAFDAAVEMEALARAARGEALTEGAVTPPPEGETEAWARASEAALAAGDGPAVLAAAGLVPDVTVPVHAHPAPRDPLATEPAYLEALAFDAGIKPALYLTVERARAAEWRARYRGCGVEEVAYRCDLDVVSDVRHRAPAAPGTGTHVDLFIARDPSAARRARAIYEDPRGPTAHLAEMGEILGYPPCCVASFAALADRSNNTAIRYAAWTRTQALGAPFAAELNNLFAHVVPFFPCSYGCPRGAAQARAVLDAFGRADPTAASALRARLARPVLYVDHARQVGLDGARWDGDVLRYRTALGRLAPGRERTEPVAGRFEAALSAVLSRGDGLRALGDRWEVLSGDRVAATLTRRAPGLGVLFPFGVGAAELPDGGTTARGA